MSEEMDMSDERPPKKLLDKGWRPFTIKSCVEETSKSGNKMYVMGFLDKETGYIDTVYAVAEKGKRWILKMILEACNVKCEDGKYIFEPPLSQHVIDKDVDGFVEHSPNEYIDRQGVTIKTTQHNIVDFKMSGWDD